LNGIFKLENEEWPEASKSFVTAKTIYEQLASVSNLEAQDLFQQRVEEIETSIRYCSYKMGKKESIQKLIDNISEDPAVVSLREKLESVLDKERGKQADAMKEINWREKRLPVKNEKIRLNIVGAQDLVTQIDGAEGFDKKMKLYDQILSKYNDAMRYIREELTAMSVSIPRRSFSNKNNGCAHRAVTKTITTLTRVLAKKACNYCKNLLTSIDWKALRLVT
jgi:signal recognition particle subunit SRP68